MPGFFKLRVLLIRYVEKGLVHVLVVTPENARRQAQMKRGPRELPGHRRVQTSAAILLSQRFEEIPLILETIDPDRWPEEIGLLKSFAL